MVVVVFPDRGAGNDPEALGLAFHQGPTKGVMTCLGKGYQHPPSASSSSNKIQFTLHNVNIAVTFQVDSCN